MENVLLMVVAFLGFITLFTLAVRYGTVFAGRILGEKVSALHHAMEYILDTEKIPPEWLDPVRPEPWQAAAWQERQKQIAIKKLRQLRSYAQTTPSMSDPESREYVTAELGRIEAEWIQKDFSELVAVSPTEQKLSH